MQKEANPWILGRRGVLTLAGACLLPWEGLYAKEFWDKKDPSQWTGEEIDLLTTKSPWAKQVTAQFAPGESERGQGQGRGQGRGQGGGGGYPRGGPTIGIGGIGIGMPRGRGMGGGRNGRGGEGGNGGSSPYKGTVRWESATPVREALKNPLPDAFANRYVIGMRDIPLLDDRRRSEDDEDSSSTQTKDKDKDTETISRLKAYTNLQVKGKDSTQPGVVQQMTPGGTYYLFGFSKDFFEFGKDDYVEFSTKLGKLTVKAKFSLAEMKYHGKLAV